MEGIEIEWKPLEEIATITIGEFVHKNSQDSSAKYPVYNGGTSPTGYYDKYNNSGNKIIVSARGANAGFVNRISKPYWAGNSCYSIGIKDPSKVNWEYVYDFLKGNESKLIGSQQKAGIPAVSKKQMEIFHVPIPAPEIQLQIIQHLDALTKYSTELSTELSAELSNRIKQFEYYRNMLLTFPNNHLES